MPTAIIQTFFWIIAQPQGFVRPSVFYILMGEWVEVEHSISSTRLKMSGGSESSGSSDITTGSKYDYCETVN